MNLRLYNVFASMDWGWNSPGCVLWWVALPTGAYHVAAEWKFRQTTAEDAAREIKKQTADLGVKRLQYLVADPAMWAKTGAGRGESIAETLLRLGLPMRKGDNDRFNGWQRVHQLLRPMPDNRRPWLTIEPTCRYLIRTIPAMMQDTKDPDDLDTTKDDHGVDALRYGAMSRPSPGKPKRDEAGEDVPNSWGWWRAYHRKQEQGTGVLA